MLTASTAGVFAGVEGNAINKLATELDEREKQLDLRESALIDKRINDQNKGPLIIISFVGLGLLGLILLNFYMDSKRRMNLAS